MLSFFSFELYVEFPMEFPPTTKQIAYNEFCTASITV